MSLPLVDVVTVTDSTDSGHSVPSRSRRLLRIDSVVQNDVEQRLMNPDAAVVFNKAEVAKAIHEEADAGPGSSNHFCQGFLRDLWNQRFRFSRLAKFGQQQENSCQTLFAGVEKLIDKIGLGSHAAGQQKL